MNKKQIAFVDLELKEMLRKRAIKRTRPAQGEFLSKLFLVGKKDGGYRPVINLEMLNQFIPFLHFKIEGLSQLKHIIQEGYWMCKLDLKDAYFSVPLDRNSRKISVEGDSPRVHVPVFWTRPSNKGVYKVIENSNLSPEKDQHQSDNLFGRYVDFESHNMRSLHEPRQSHISPAEFGLYNKHKETN